MNNAPEKGTETGSRPQQTGEETPGYPVHWPSYAVGSKTDWIEYVMPPDGEDDLATLYRVDVSFYRSTWTCIYGRCPSTMYSGVTTAHGCCQLGVQFYGRSGDPNGPIEDFENVAQYVDKLTEEDCDNIAEIRENGWYTKKSVGQRKGSRGRRVPNATRVYDSACIFSNRADSPTGKPGCALHHLADRMGLHHSDTKPFICWSIPLAVDEDYDSEFDMNLVVMSGTPAPRWGSGDNGSSDHLGYWCVDTPDAYQETDQMVYKTAEQELRRLIGDKPYEELVRQLDAIQRRFPMPGETIAGGRPLIPLLVQQRVDLWKAEATSSDGPEAERAIQALMNSAEYLETHGIVPGKGKK